MDVVYASDDGFCRHAAVSMFSLLDHNDGEDITLHVLSNGICEEYRDRLRGIADGFGRDIYFYELQDFEGAIRERVPGVDTGRFNITTLARLLIGSLLPESVERALYLDADTVVLQNLRELCAAPLAQCIAAAVPEPTIYPQVRAEIGLSDGDEYFNAGVMLFDLKKWRAEGMEEKGFAYYREKGGKLPFNDQDILNHILKNRIAVLPQRFNFFSNYHYFHYRTLIQMAPWYAGCETAHSFHEAGRHPAVVHFAGDERPWYAGSMNYYRHAYRLYLNTTPWAGEPNEKGKRLYMLAYHLMNLATWIFPASRRLISARYYENSVHHSEL